MRQHPDAMTRHAREMRQNPTLAERLLWRALRRRVLGARFRRQEPKGAYILDFVCLEHRLVIEADGHQHAESSYDRERDAWLDQEGFLVMRFSNGEIIENLDGVLLAIEAALIELGVSGTPSQPAEE